jgi:hypothetical protein
MLKENTILDADLVKKGKVKQYIPEEAQPYFLANNGKKLLK